MNKHDIQPASQTLALAFQDYSLFRYAYPDKSFRGKILPHYYRMLLFYATRYGEVYATSGNMEGIAAWISSDYFPTFRRMLSSVPLSVLGGFIRAGASNPVQTIAGSSRLRKPGRRIFEIHRRQAPFKHWFLMVIGVAPRFQGQGNASRLILPMLNRIDSESLPCYTDTQEERNVRLYERYGFKIVEKQTIPGTWLTTWGLLRVKPPVTGEFNSIS